ncbi:hypothetical protein BU25DRAFT_236335 [Macroventuria anomochaeta]|uniref:Uncharacterized protein n=1 Tax=Macroventuria anomochaeta TaxID=301207 RepID=A0ACB6RHY1_9PLEO|nr:uncharacterized protein BU25DRAFT_236335 [Macroventuria anomochaeta]KAF2621496.1 hypothetical protein BU25DRAFT_236335 [Macroventuria anomochaeta]
MEGSASASAEGADSPVNARPKRSRTGCMTCRNRRRKCDEGKPICQNCISKGFECRYASAFQILGKHNFTPEVKTDVKYANVRFAGDDGEEPVSETANQPAKAAGSRQNAPAQTQSVVLPDRQVGTTSIDTSTQSHSGHKLPPNNYEFASDGLLALGFTSGTAQGADFFVVPSVREKHAVSTFDFARDDNLDPTLNGNSLERRPGVHRTETGHQSTLSFDTIGHSMPGPSPGFQNFRGSEDLNRIHGAPNSNAMIPAGGHPAHAVAAGRDLELLKFYRYNIAPWLDICDTDQHFGVALLTNPTQVPSLRASVIRLAASSSNMAWVLEDLDVGKSTSERGMNDSAAPNATLETVVCVLDVLADMIPNLAAIWLRSDSGQSRMYLLEKLLLELGSSSLNACGYWLLVRLELSRALMAGNSRIPLPSLTGQPGGPGNIDSIAQCAYDAVALCVDSAMFAKGDGDRWLQQRYGLNRVEVWNTLVQSFAHWYMHRSQAFQPIIELYPKDGVLADDDYPTIVFTSGAALLANQLYHTGMLLLLQNKPRFGDKPNQNSPSMSTLWHAHRICGIAIQNDRPGWWDPCLVASLIVAGRTATHASQHNAIVRTLEFVQRLTGWTIHPYVDQLRSEWQLADGW